jgi:N-acetylneuraminic acid mutarotase
LHCAAFASVSNNPFNPAMSYKKSFANEMKSTHLPASQTGFSWSELPQIPDPYGYAGGFAGVSNGALLFAGGANFPDGGKPWSGSKKVWSDLVFVLEKPDGSWRLAGKLPRPLGYGVSVSFQKRVICIGGSNDERHCAEVFAITYKNGELCFDSLPDLPEALANSCGGIVGNVLFIAGGISTPTSTIASEAFYSLDLSAKDAHWMKLPTWPGPSRMLSVSGVQNNQFHLFSGVAIHKGRDGSPVRKYLTDAYSFDPRNGWKRLADMPRPAVAAASPAYPIKSHSLAVFGGDDGLLAFEASTLKDSHPGFSNEILEYMVETNRWESLGQIKVLKRDDVVQHPNESIWAPVTLPLVLWNDGLVFPNGEVRPAVRTPRILIAHPFYQ